MASQFSKTFIRRNLIQTRPMTKYVIANVYKSSIWLKTEKNQTFCAISTISEAGQIICCSSKKVDRTMLYAKTDMKS